MEPNAGALVSGEGVRLALEPAGVGSRTLAAAIDLAIQVAAFFVLAITVELVAGNSDTAALQALLVTDIVLVLAVYPIVLEWVLRGRTVGKVALGLRVVRDDGGPIGFRHALVRGLAGLVLEKPGLLLPLTTVAGLVTISSSAREKRLGDMMAGTVVLNERTAAQPPGAPPAWVPPPLQPWALALDLHRLDDRLALVTRQFAGRAYAMSPAARYEIGELLRRRIESVVSPPPPPGLVTQDVLLTVLAERRRRAGAAAVAATTPSRRPVPYPANPPVPTPAPAPSRPRPDDSPFARPE